jgi:hypothetical protein
VINISSYAVKRADRRPRLSNGVRSGVGSPSLARVAKDNILVNNVCPGRIRPTGAKK